MVVTKSKVDMSSRLIVKDAGKKKVVKLGDEVVSFGRATSNTVPIKDSASSRHHCQVTHKDGGYVVQDLGSRNGTLVNKESISEHVLEEGDVIQIGKAKIMFMSGPASPSEPKLEIVQAKDEEKHRASKRRKAPEDPETLTLTKKQLDDYADDQEDLSLEAPEASEAALLDGLEEKHFLVHYLGDKERTHGIRGTVTTIGRVSSNDISIKGEESVSSKHAELRLEDATFVLKDLGSTNGTKVNGIKIATHTLKPGDIIEFGRAQFLFHNESFTQGEISTLKGANVPDYSPASASTAAYAAEGPSVLSFMMPFLLTIGVMTLVIGGLAYYAMSGIKQTKPDVPVIPDNLIDNYSFEDQYQGQPVGWQMGAKEGISVKAVGEAPSGKHVLEITQGETEEELPIRWVSFDRTLKVQAALSYKAEAQIKHTSGNGFAALRLRWLSSTNPDFVIDDYTKLLPQGSGWKPVDGTFQAPSGADIVQLACVVIGQVEGVQFDHVLLSKGGGDVQIMPDLESGEGSVKINRAGLITLYQGRTAQVFGSGRLLIVDENDEVMYDQSLLEMTSKPVLEDDELTITGKIPPLRGGSMLPVTIRIAKHEQGFSLKYQVDESIEMAGASLRFRATVAELDSGSAMAIESRGVFEKLRGAFVRPQVSLFRWKGLERHLGLYADEPAWLRYDKDPELVLDVFNELPAESSKPSLGFRIRLNFAEDRTAMKAAFDKAHQAKSSGKPGQGWQAFKAIIRTYPFIDESGDAHKMVAKIEAEAETELRDRNAEFERARYFGRSSELLKLRERLNSLIKRYTPMPILTRAQELDKKVESELTTVQDKENQETAAGLLQRGLDFKEVGMKGMAILVLTRLKEKYPKTPQAADADRVLKELEKN